jgi:hypothetical protein
MSLRMVTQRVSVKASRFAVPPKHLTTYDDAEFRFLAIAARE